MAYQIVHQIFAVIESTNGVGGLRLETDKETGKVKITAFSSTPLKTEAFVPLADLKQIVHLKRTDIPKRYFGSLDRVCKVIDRRGSKLFFYFVPVQGKDVPLVCVETYDLSHALRDLGRVERERRDRP